METDDEIPLLQKDPFINNWYVRRMKSLSPKIYCYGCLHWRHDICCIEKVFLPDSSFIIPNKATQSNCGCRGDLLFRKELKYWKEVHRTQPLKFRLLNCLGYISYRLEVAVWNKDLIEF